MHYKLKTLYPTAPDGAWELQDNSDGQGPFISYWDEAALGPQPSQATIDAADGTAAQQKQAALGSLASSDQQMARIAEDVIDALVSNANLALTDLPQAAQDLIARRKTARAKL